MKTTSTTNNIQHEMRTTVTSFHNNMFYVSYRGLLGGTWLEVIAGARFRGRGSESEKRQVRKGLIPVSRWWSGCPPSAQFILGVVLVQQFDVRERKVAMLAFTFALPLAAHVYFGHLHHVAHLRGEGTHEEQRNDNMVYYTLMSNRVQTIDESIY
ncbi:hypothetical protein GOODEAATRI_006102 [Goodea atripinnis]|uniref:Uncharacterized protein n=1 Tax=Goodea atripinnis TaxID=208336 RepID=A0ABV0MFH7_9TELE